MYWLGCTRAQDQVVEGTVEKVDLDIGASREASRTGKLAYSYLLVVHQVLAYQPVGILCEAPVLVAGVCRFVLIPTVPKIKVCENL